MAAEPSSFLLCAQSSGQLITSVNPNDVILGRGSGPSQFIGNQRFRSIVYQHQEEYNSIRGDRKSEQQKTIISKKIVDKIHALGGRFLRYNEGETSVAGALAEGVTWLEVEESVALEKCKQALRDKRRKKSSSTENGVKNLSEEPSQPESEGLSWAASPPNAISGNSFTLGNVIEVASPLPEGTTHTTTAPLAVLPLNSTLVSSSLLARLSAFHHHSMPPQLHATNPVNASESVLDPHTWKYNDDVVNGVILSSSTPALPSVLDESSDVGNANNLRFTFNQEAMLPHQQGTNLANPSQIDHDPLSQNDVRFIPDAISVASREILPCAINDFAPEHGVVTDNVTNGQEKVANDERKHDENNAATQHRSTSGVSAMASKGDLSSYLLSLLISDRPMITEQQLEIERAAMTDEERVATLTDLFGKQCAVDTQQRKKARRDLDTNSVGYLVNQMRLEIERIPEHSKRALLEAQTKSHAEEFSDARLEKFLRCEDMNVKLGAQRFVAYWESRQQVFGPEKFVLKMTLSGALCDDLTALEACVIRPLPRLDTSGRQLVLFEPSRHTRKGYTSESMLRAVWYVMEVMAQTNIEPQAGYVVVNWLKNFTMWEYDHTVYDGIILFDRTSWPVKVIANHLCCPPWIVVNVIQPLINAVFDKRARGRKLEHCVPECQILNVLSSYGIMPDMLPTEMGGTIELSQSEWIANRRAMELEEI